MNEKMRKWWIARLNKLYNAAKRRHGGRSLNIYSDVSQLLNYLEGTEEPPQGFNLAAECDNLADRLRRA